jgi:hypothetical protein
VDGAGYQTQFILFNTSTTSGTVRLALFDEQGGT